LHEHAEVEVTRKGCKDPRRVSLLRLYHAMLPRDLALSRGGVEAGYRGLSCRYCLGENFGAKRLRDVAGELRIKGEGNSCHVRLKCVCDGNGKVTSGVGRIPLS
jgi:hypothetical protein